jgi:hypothetical protein
MDEFAASGISPELAAASVQWLEGRWALVELIEDRCSELQRNSTYVTGRETDGATSVAGLRKAYSFIEAGGWFATPANATPAYCKPATPRMDETRQRVIKYETARGGQPLPLLPNLPSGMTWDGEAIAITEGWKKALALVQYGLPAVALRGITQWHAKGSRELWPELAAAVAGKVVYLAFDQDEKRRTRRDVSRQCLALARAVVAAGGVPRVLWWDGSKGKGIDDLLVGFPQGDRVDTLAGLCKKSLSLKDYQRQATLAQAAAILDIAPPVAQHNTEGEYIPVLPPLQVGVLHWVDAPMNSGKSYRIGRDWVKPWAAGGGVVVVLSPLNSLGMQSAREWDLPHIHEYKTDPISRRALEADVSSRGGLVACFNSLHRVVSLIPSGRPLLLVVDEAAQVLDGAGEGGTLRGIWSDRWESFIALSRRAVEGGAIALAEAGLDQATISLVQSLSGAPQVVGLRHSKESEPWDVEFTEAHPLSGWRAGLLTDLEHSGENILFVTTSQAEGRRLQRAAAQKGIEAIRIDSETNEGGKFREFFETPESWLHSVRPRLLILSPSAKTGLSIEGGISAEDAYFCRVYGYFPSLDTDTHLQLLGRYRPPVPRIIWTPAYINPEPNEKPSKFAIAHGLSKEAADYARAGGFEQSPDTTEETTIAQYLATRRSRRWAQKINPGGALRDVLQAAGHEITEAGAAKDDNVINLWKDIKEAIAREDAELYAGLELKSTDNLKWAKETLAAVDSSHLARCRAQKVLTALRFPNPNLDWNCAELWYQAQFAPRDGDQGGPLAPGAALWAESEHYRDIWADDAKEAATVLTQRLKAVHLLPKAGARAALGAIFKPYADKLLQAGKVVPGGATEGEIKAIALRYSDQLRRYWRLSITADQSDTAIANKICRKFGLTLERLAKVTNDQGDRVWTYFIAADQVWRSLVDARRWALSQSGTDSLEETLNRFVPDPDDDQDDGDPIADSPPLSGDSPDEKGQAGQIKMFAA